MAKRKQMTAKDLRDYLESMPCPFCTDGVTDGELEAISASLEIEMKDILQWENEEELEKLKEYDNGEDFFINGCILFTEEL